MVNALGNLPENAGDIADSDGDGTGHPWTGLDGYDGADGPAADAEGELRRILGWVTSFLSQRREAYCR